MNVLERIGILLLESKKKSKWKDKVTHPGLLEIPSDKSITEMPESHFITLAKKKGRNAVVKGLMNLYRWNKNSNPKLSSWAKKMQETVSKAMEGEK